MDSLTPTYIPNKFIIVRQVNPVTGQTRQVHLFKETTKPTGCETYPANSPERCAIRQLMGATYPAGDPRLDSHPPWIRVCDRRFCACRMNQQGYRQFNAIETPEEAKALLNHLNNGEDTSIIALPPAVKYAAKRLVKQTGKPTNN